MIEIVHCVIDDKFTNGVIEVFNNTQGSHHNSYVFFPEGEQPSNFRYLRYPNDVTIVKRQKALSYINSIPCDVLILHNLSSFPIEDLQNVPSRIKVVWFAWGFDLYSPFKGHSPFIPINLYLPMTKAVMIEDWANQIKMLIKRMRWKALGYHKMVEKGIARVDFFSGVIPWEYEMMTKNRFFKARQVDFTYFDMNSYATDATLMRPINRGENVMIGNSGGTTNNHIDTMNQLGQIDIKGKKVIVPLSYGGGKRYVGKVIKVGKKLWGEQFFPLNTFLPLDEYHKIISSCGYAVYGIERQQALGNILMALWDGLVVFLSKTSPLYLHLKQLGFRIFTIQDDLHLIAEGHRLRDNEIMENRKVWLQFYSQEICLNKIVVLYKTIDSNE